MSVANDRQQIRHARFVLRVEFDVASTVGDRRLQLLDVRLDVVQEIEATGTTEAFAHLFGRVLQVQDLGGLLEDVRRRDNKRVTEGGVEALS